MHREEVDGRGGVACDGGEKEEIREQRIIGERNLKHIKEWQENRHLCTQATTQKGNGDKWVRRS